MTAPIFKWTPNHPIASSVEPRLRVVQFGDGYREAAPDGLNFIPEQVAITLLGKVSNKDPRSNLDVLKTKDEIEAFLRERGGYKPFYFSFRNTQRIGLYVCPRYRISSRPGDIWDISMELQQDFSEPNVYQPLYDLFGGSPTTDLQALEDFVNSESYP